MSRAKLSDCSCYSGRSMRQMTSTTALLLCKAALDTGIMISALYRKDYAGAFLFFTVVLMDFATIGVMK